MFYPNDWVTICVEGDGDLNGKVVGVYGEICKFKDGKMEVEPSAELVYRVAVSDGFRFVKERENNIRILDKPDIADVIRVECALRTSLDLTATSYQEVIAIAYAVYSGLKEWAKVNNGKPDDIFQFTIIPLVPNNKK